MIKSFVKDADDLSFIIFYGSQLGQAKSIAEGLADTAEQFNLKTKAFELNSIKDVNDLTKVNFPIVIITSTTGDGEPPESADKFWRKIRKKNLDPDTLSCVKYSILGLGDTNYNNFCNCGKEINRRLSALGATAFYPPAWADDAIGLESVVDDWIENLWLVLENLINPDNTTSLLHTDMEKAALTVPSCPARSLDLTWIEEETPSISRKDLLSPLAPYPLIDGDPVGAKMKSARVLTRPGAVKTALEFTLEFVDKPLKFQPGDSINIVCPNLEFEIDQIFQRLNLSSFANKTLQLKKKEGAKGKIPEFLPVTIKLSDAFKYFLDIRSCPKKNFLRLLAEYTSEENEKSQLLKLCSRQGSSEFESTVRFASLSFLDLLLTFPSCMPPLEALLEHLPRLTPRAYSIASSPLVDDKSFSFVFNIIVIPKENGRQYERLGVCTGWLAKMAKSNNDNTLDGLDELLKSLTFQDKQIQSSENSLVNDEIVVYKRKNQQFRLPESNNPPIIMVGPGTGVAPFLGFLQHRSKLKESGDVKFGEMSLYFGCRHKSKDFLYEDQFLKHQQDILSKFYPVFSRDNPDSAIKYVQHRMEEQKQEVVSTLLDNGGYLYVCGDAKNMAKDVRETLVRCVQSIKNASEAEAKTLINELVTQKRYLQDIWT